MCSEGEVMAAALPAHFKLSSETILIFNEEGRRRFLSPRRRRVHSCRSLAIKKQLKIAEVQQVLDSFACLPCNKKT
jgi:primosomal protein N' (replication factor Y)